MAKLPRCVRCGATIEPAFYRRGCRACGAVFPVHDATNALLSKLSQLARFGLAAEDPPLLEPLREE